MNTPVSLIRVAIVEDDVPCGESLRDLFYATAGFECHQSFATADAALSALPQAPSDLVIVDLDLPGISGVKLLRELRRRQVLSRTVVLTA